MSHWEDRETHHRARSAVFMSKTQGHWLWYTTSRKFPVEAMNSTKHHQWMIAPRSYIHYLRNEDTDAHEILMYMESSAFTDEWFFATTILTKNHPFEKKVINDNKRYIPPFNGRPHPEPITIQDIPLIETRLKEKEFYFIRKVDVVKVIQRLDELRQEIDLN